ncbi:M23 family metallopeptidase [Roseivivax isoporae]|uniref:Peptidase M23 n=1 Tax=Roseivivax isoporae LMG 25204 TaxID=1449351 RepID=X7F4E2_9RHOB|nr:M23 family metallopeptidase [Roseivivax isoporae]ETX27583.1 peptidase M23 [Roseivivax isoporae LMG 25204]
MKPGLSALALLASAAPVAAEVAFLDLPLACTLGQDCFIEDYMDADPGPGVADYTCGLKARQDHGGTDFALLSFEAMEAGVDVLAAAPGTVEAVRDGEPDIALTPGRRAEIAGRECGNAVRIGHPNGLQTLYCHLKRGSLAVTPGTEVAAGDVLGQVGLSGETNYPHLHLTVLKDGARVDPFAPEAGAACGSGGPTLWTDPPAYERAGLFTAGMSDAVPDLEDVQSGAARRTTLGPGDAIVLYGHAFHAATGDVLHLSATGPEGALFEEAVEIARGQAQLFRAVGRRAPEGGWAPGTYRGTVRHMRGDTAIAVRHAEVAVR